MLTCADAEALIAGRVDGTLCDAEDDAALTQHVSGCAACRQVLNDHAAVARTLGARPEATLPTTFSRRLSDRLDAEVSWLDAVNWRSWTVRLAPVAAALMIAAAVTAERGTLDNDDGIDLAQVAEAWAVDPEFAGLPTTALFWQDEVSPDLMLEAVLTSNPDDLLEEGGIEQ